MGYGREDVRLETEIEINVSTVYDEDGILLPAVSEMKMYITNMSATGIALRCDREFKEKTSFYFELELNEQVIKLMPIIVRKTKGKGKEWIYGCKLMHLDPNEEQIIRKYIFDSEISKRKIRRP